MRRVKTIAICIPDELAEELRRAAYNEGRSVSSMAARLLAVALQLREEVKDG